MKGLKPLVALYKAYRGGEWFGPSLESVRPHCAGVVAVLSDRPWPRSAGAEPADAGRRTPYRGRRQAPPPPVSPPAPAPENCSAPLERFRLSHPECQVTAIRPGVAQDTEGQYRLGLAVIKAMYGADCGVLIVDTDEVWDDAGLSALRVAMTHDRRSLYFRSGILTYVRSPLYRVSPREKARPVVGLANPDLPTGRSRFSELHSLARADRVRDVDCDMHHFGYVRLDAGEIMSKLAATSDQDGTRFRHDWISTVWDRLPGGSDLHPTPGFERCWAAVEEITAADLPKAAAASDTFRLTLAAHHRPAAGPPGGDPAWRAFAEADVNGVVTTVPAGEAPALSAALTVLSAGRATAELCEFLVPRLRTSTRETIELARHAAAVPAGGLALEVGSGLGGSMAVIGLCTPPGTALFAVDPFVPYDEENVTLCRGVEVASVSDFLGTINRVGLDVTLARSSSHEARSTWPGQAIDLLLIDGNHSYAYALYDLYSWWPLVRPGGVMLAHDLSGRFPGVVRAVREFEASHGVCFQLPGGSSLAWLRKGA